MRSQDGSLTLTFNGEIYNWRELRGELQAVGLTFTTETDSEVLLGAYQVWGTAMLPRLRGMYAFAIYDARDGTLLCARDRIGKKPFVYAESVQGFAFASEIPALATFPGWDRRLDHAALAGMLLHNVRHVVDPHTAYRGLKRLRPGHAMVVRDGRISHIWRHWTPQRYEGPVTSKALRSVLEETVDLRMRADVPVGALLSGGVDSTAIVALMTQRSADPIRTYALGFDPNDEDLRRARVAAQTLGCSHREFYFNPSAQWQSFNNLIAQHGEPIMLLPLLHTYQLCEAIRNDGVKVVLGGHGADELFYGYTGHVRTAWLSEFASLAAPLAPMGGLLPDSIRPLLAPPGHRKAALYRSVEDAMWSPIIAPESTVGLRNAVADELEYWEPLCPSQSLIDGSNFAALMVENTHSLTIASDLPAMAHSVEMRSPFLDQRMIEFAYSVPLRDKVPRWRPLHRLKSILRTAVKDLVPPELLNAPKRGFGSGIPQDAVLRGPWRAAAEALFNDPDDADGLFDKDAVRGAWKRFAMEGGRNTNTVANLFAIQYWLQNGRLT